MATLGQLGVNGLLAVNSWIGMINSNLQGSSRTAYKPTRQSFTDGVVTRLAANIQIPSPTLNVQATTLEWAQGPITNSNFRSHFALQGGGFFVLADPAGKYYLSRDGEFHWDHQGFLANSAGLRVLSAGQDFIRFDRTDFSDTFDFEGESVELKKYGNKSFLIVDVANRDGLRFSRHGATVFELDGDLPLRVRNNFKTTMDGLTFLYKDPKQRTRVDAPEAPFVLGPVSAATDFSIDFGHNGVYNFSRAGSPLGGAFFNPAVHTIQDVVNGINDYAADNNINISASFDPGTDRIRIINIPEPKVVDPLFTNGNFAIDFGANGLFTYHGFDPKRTTIQNIVDAINAYGLQFGGNVSAVYNVGTDRFTINNNTGPGLDNQISFTGANGNAIARFMQMAASNPSTGGGPRALPSTTDVDRFPLITATNTFADISPFDVSQTSLFDLVHPPSRILFGGPNGQALANFFRLTPEYPEVAVNPVNRFIGSQLLSTRDIDNSNILTNTNPALHDLDITAGDVATSSFVNLSSVPDLTVPANDLSGAPGTYFHDVQNSRVVMDATGFTIPTRSMVAISQGQTTDAFELVIDYKTLSGPNSALLDLNFGYSKPEQIDSGGFTFSYNPQTGGGLLMLRDKDPNKAPVVLSTLPAGSFPATNGLGGAPHRLAASLDKDGLFKISIDGSAAAVFNLSGFSQQRSGYMSLSQSSDQGPNRLELYNLYADFKGMQNQLATGELLSVGPTPYASPEVREGHQERERTRIQQAALESSTASLTEYVPMLALAQKVFSALSKIISVSSALDDDINSLIR